jgi:DNA polymerase-1
MGCRECGLNVHSDPTCIPGSGNPKAKIMIVNSYAGDQDEEAGEAVMSPHILDYIKKLDIDPGDVYYTNAIKCRAPKGTKFKVGEIKKCKVHLDAEIAKVKPQYVLLVGAQSVKATIDGSITELNGVTVEKDGIKYLPTYSPGIVYKDPAKAPFVQKAALNFKSLIAGKEIKLPELNIVMLHSKQDIDQAFEDIKESGFRAFSYDIETSGLNRFEEFVRAIGFGNDEVQYILPLEVNYSPLRGKHIAQKKLVRYLVRRLNKVLKIRIAGNGKFDNLFLEHHFGVKPHLDFDVVLASHILNENTPNGVKENAVLECNALDWDIDKSLKQGNVKNREDYKKYTTYLGYDIYYEYQLYKVFKKKIKADDALDKIFNYLYMPGIRAYEEIESHGVYIYKQQFREARKYLDEELTKIERQLGRYQKEEMNWNSTQQVAELLYKKLKLPVIETTEAGKPSTSEATLMQLRDKHPVVELILKYRGVHIQISHFIDGWMNRMQNHRLFPNFKLHGTVTGRTSCTDPNLQQVPRDPKIRNLVGAPEGYSFVEADFSQAELRIATILSGDPAMKRIYQTGGDIHTATYELMTGEEVSTDKQTRKEQRKKAKAVNFGFLYGMGWRKFKDYARDTYELILTEKEAQEYRKKFFEVYSKLPEWHARQRRIVKAMGQVRNPIGRIRRLLDVHSSEQGKVAEAERQSINSPVQGFGSDLTILGMIEVMQHSKLYHEDLKLDRTKFHSVGTVHDATLFEVRNDYLMEFIPKVKQIMENPRVLEEVFNFVSPIPIIVDVSVGKSWGAGIELKFEDDKWKKQVEEFLGLHE